MLHCLFYLRKKRQIKGCRIYITLNEQVSVNQSKWITNSEKNSCISQGLSNYRPVFMKARLQLNGPVWASCKHNQREPIAARPRCPYAEEKFSDLTGEVQRKHASGQLVPIPPFYFFFLNLITVMSLETAGCTTANVDAGKTHGTQVLLAAESKAHHQAQTQHR